MRKVFLQWLAVFTLGALCLPAYAQELTPRAYWPAPVATNIFFLTYQYSSGDILTDPTLPLVGVDSRNNSALLSFRHNFSFFGRTANVQFSLPHIWSTTRGEVEGEFRRRDVSAFGDSSVQFTVNLLGAPAMDRKAFQQLRANPRPIVGASVLLRAPTGGYDENFYINAGTNRWSAKIGLGAIWPIRPTWLFEADLGYWVFGDNDEFVGQTRKQDPIASASFHLVKRFRPGFWASLDANYYRGGESVVDETSRDDLQRNSRAGVTVVVPLKPKHALRMSYSTGVVTESGGDFDQITLNYAYAW